MRTLLAVSLMSLLLSACGGGGGSADPGTPTFNPPTVNGISANALKYGQTAVFTVTGSALESGNLKVTTNRCTEPTLIAGGSATERKFSCRLTGFGSLVVTVSDPAAKALLSNTFNVPQPQVQLQTSLGNILVDLNPNAAPVTVNNFLNYVNAGYYTGTLFHRVVFGFVVQGGGFTSGLVPKAPIADPIVLESNNGLSNTRGTIAMARTPAANSATSQFYFNLVDNPNLNYVSAGAPGYAVFGAIREGLNVMDAIASITTRTDGATGLTNVPSTEVVILGATQVQ